MPNPKTWLPNEEAEVECTPDSCNPIKRSVCRVYDVSYRPSDDEDGEYVGVQSFINYLQSKGFIFVTCVGGNNLVFNVSEVRLAECRVIEYFSGEPFLGMGSAETHSWADLSDLAMHVSKQENIGKKVLTTAIANLVQQDILVESNKKIDGKMVPGYKYVD